ncbi:MAG: hypothetical protein HC805_08035 [Alkalinema sp. RL_2_19]|nr:hypothetical protein [Alkalinema sp. RL_2_19]
MTGDTAARLLWVASDCDVALVELAESIPDCDAVRLGRLPSAGGSSAPLNYCSCGWAWWTCSKLPDGEYAARREFPGQIYLGDVSPEGLLVLEAGRYPATSQCPPQDVPGNPRSPWEGASGSAIVCQGYVIAIQSQHQRPDRPQSLEATPLTRVFDDPDWQRHLVDHGIDSTVHDLEIAESSNVRSVTVQPSNNVEMSDEQRMARALWSLNYQDQQDVFDAWLDDDRVAGAFAMRWVLILKRICRNAW